MKTKFVAIVALVVLVALFSNFDFAQAQSRGKITGRVYDASSGEYLPGANVMIEGTNFGSATGRSGEYRIEHVPFGTFTLNVSYIGYDDYSAEVTVSSSEPTVKHDVPLKVSFVEMEAVEVTGQREGQMRALSQQKTAANIKNVVASEQMQRFPDLNTAEVLQRIPAVSITRDQGEGRYVLIRGTEARLNSISVNGERIASPEGENRYIGLDVISTSQISSIEVTKAITPDMDADAIGGSVNMVTRSAFDSDKRIMKVSLGSGYSELMDKPLYQGDFIFSDRFGAENNIGLTLSANYYQSNRGSDNNEMEWDLDDNDVWVLQNMELRDYIVTRDRWGIASTLEYLLNEDNRIYVRGMYNQRDDYEYRRLLGIIPEDGDYQSPTSITGGEMERELKDRLERQSIYNIAAGGEHKLGLFDVDYTLSYSYGEESKPDETDPAFVLNENVDLSLNLSDTDLPKYQITNLASDYQHNAENWVLDEVAYEENLSEDTEMLASLNIKYPYLLGNSSAELKFGGKIHTRDKTQNDLVWEYGWEGDDDVLLSQFVADDEDTDFMNGEYRIGPSVDGDKFRDFFEANRDGLLEGEINREDTDAANYEAKENIFAYYGMTTNNFGKLQVLAGFRHEITSIDYSGNEVLFDEEGDYVNTNAVQNDDSYSHFLPMIHFRYRLTPRTNFRLAATSGLARPNYYDLVPYRLINREDEEMAIGNPALLPTTAYNLDLLAEHYLPGIGIISGGVFYKALDDIIYTQFFEQEGGEYDGYEVSQPVNGESASLYGFELNWQQQLTFLPGFWNGFGIYANYTYSKSTADVQERSDISLPGQAGNVANFALSYEKYGFTGRLSLNYHGKYIDEVGESEDYDIYYNDHMQLDLSLSQQVYPGLQVYLEAINLTDEPLRYYMGDEERPIQR
ncbi:TonB-dependent receptor, partial [candidate division KSB1 bacterium]|nr:TonB-dependent receptor [candidate division KSB1 bacterium]